MKALISCDEHGLFKEGVYYLKNFDTVLVNRYLDVYESIKLIIRIEETCNVNFEKYQAVVDKRIEIIPILMFQGPVSFFRIFNKINKQLALIKHDYNVAIVRIPSTIGFMVFYKFRKKFKSLGLEVVANPYELYISKKWTFEGLFYFIYHIMQLYACRNANAIAYVTKSSLQKTYKPGMKTSFITHYSSVNILKEQFTGARSKRTNNVEILICHVSHPIKTYDKGHLQVIDIVCKLREQNYPVSVTFAGSGEKIKEFISYSKTKNIEKYINFVGLLEYNDLFNLLQKSDIMVFPTVSEGLPRVLIEAIAVGLPCLSTPVSGIPELIDSEFLVPLNDIDTYVEKIINFITNDALYFETSKNNFERSLEYEAENLQKKRIEFFNFLLKISRNE